MNVDDFFAKKDRGKKDKKKAKFTTLDTITKNLEEESNPREDTAKKENEQSGKSSIRPASDWPFELTNVLVQQGDEGDDEWECPLVEKENDYSGLKVQFLSVSERVHEEELLKERAVSEANVRAEGDTGPWKIIQPSPENSPEKKPKVDVAEAESKPVHLPYVPPALRRKNAGASFASACQKSKKTGESNLEISSELQFPSLASSMENRGKQNVIKGSDRNTQCPKRRSSEVPLELKKFSSLRFEDGHL